MSSLTVFLLAFASSFFRNGKGIPKYLPESTLDKALNRYEEENFINKAITRGECLDKDCNLPDIVANSKSYNYKYSYSNYTDQNEMESNISNIEHDESSSKDDDEDNLDVGVQKGLKVYRMDREKMVKESKYPIIHNLNFIF